MPEAVIVDAARSPIGRAFKGSLAQLRPEETAAYRRRQAARAQPRRLTGADRGRLLRLRHAAGPAGASTSRGSSRCSPSSSRRR